MYFEYLRKYRGRYTVGVLTLLLTNLLAMTIPWLMKMAVDSIDEVADPGLLLRYGSAMAALAVVAFLIRILSRIAILGGSRLVVHDIRNRLYHHLTLLSPSYYYRTPVGELMSRSVNDAQQVQGFLGPGFMYLVNAVLIYSLGITMMISIEPGLTFYAVLPYPLMIFLTQQVSKRLHSHFASVQEGLAALSSWVRENLSGIAVIKSYGREIDQVEAFKEANRDYCRRNIGLVKTMSLLFPMMMFFAGLGPLIVLWVGGGMMIDGSMSRGEFLAFNGYLLYLVFPTFALGWIINTLRRGMVAMGRLREVLAVAPELADRPGAPMDDFDGKIEVRDLTFSYERQMAPALKNVSFKLEPGGRLGIVGLTGSGKSTLAALIARQWAVADGHIHLDGRDVNSLPLRELRRKLGYVPQEAFIFSMTIADNLNFNPGELSPEDLDWALRTAGLADEVADLPDGLHTMLGERGVNLSGGQRQRLALARTLLARPAILILDDPLSQVDAETEQQILADLKKSVAGTTTIIIAHRISTVMDADEILVLDDGLVIERGNHRELIALGGLYARIFKHQQLEATLEKIQ